MTLEDYRRFYSEEIRLASNVRSPALVEAFATVPRERFLGPAPWQILSAERSALSSTGLSSSAYLTTQDPRDLYHNLLIAIDASRQLNNGQPSALAHWIDALDLKDGDRVFHIGCGTGYYTAIMAKVASPKGNVIACEVDPEIGARAWANLSSYPNVTVHVGDGTAFDPGNCDAMLINAGVTHPHAPWLARLVQGGRMVLPLTVSTPGSATGSGVMVKIVREPDRLSAQVITFVAIYSSASGRDPQMEQQLGKALSSKALLKLRSVRLDPHEPEDTCLVHGMDMCLSSGPA